jgi:CheY-like chemotaxis protein
VTPFYACMAVLMVSAGVGLHRGRVRRRKHRERITIVDARAGLDLTPTELVPPIAATAPVMAARPSKTVAIKDPKPVRVLLAEDNPINRRVAAVLLRRNGYHVTVVHNGEEAVTAATREQFDAVLMDVQMPMMNGFGATRVIRALDAERGGRTPVIAMTAHAMTGDRERCLLAGMDDCVAKPVRAAELRQALQAAIERSRSDQDTTQ